ERAERPFFLTRPSSFWPFALSSSRFEGARSLDPWVRSYWSFRCRADLSRRVCKVRPTGTRVKDRGAASLTRGIRPPPRRPALDVQPPITAWFARPRRWPPDARGLGCALFLPPRPGAPLHD